MCQDQAAQKFTRIVVIKIFTINLPSQPFLGRHLGFHIFFHHSLFEGRTLFLQLGCFGLDIKTHGSVSCGPRSRRATPVSILTGRTKTSFSHLCISVITYPIGTTFTTLLPASQGSLHSKSEGNRSSHFRDTSCQSFVFFLLRLFAHLQKLL